MLSEFLRANRIQLVARCREKVAARRAPRATPDELEHGVPVFLDQLTDMMSRATEIGPAQGPAARAVEIRSEADAARHGAELLRHDFPIDQVVHDYGDLCQAVTELAAEVGAPITVQEFGILNIRLDNAIAGAVTAFQRQHDLDVGGQNTQTTNDRLGALAHTMSNLLNTSILAVSAMKGGRVGFGGSTAAALDRSLIGMRALVDRTLAEVRLRRDEVRVPQRLEIGEMFAQLRVGATFEAAQKGCHLTVLVLEPGLYVDADRHILAAAISNLLQNAFRFTRKDSHVLLKAYSAHGRVLIDIEDECSGLPDEVADAILRPYAPRSGEGESLGTGLAISRAGIRASGGSLSARNVPGKGCVFTIDLPRSHSPRGSSPD